MKQYKQAKDDTNKINILNALCRVYQNTGNYNLAFHYGNAALQLSERLNFQKGIAASYSKIGITYQLQGDYSLALENLFKCLKITEETGDKRNIANSYNNIGEVYRNQGNYPLSLENYDKALKIYKEINNPDGIAMSYCNTGAIYEKQGNLSSDVSAKEDYYNKALEKFLSGIEVCGETGRKNIIAECYNGTGNIYANYARQRIFPDLTGAYYNKALENYFASLKISEKLKDKKSIANTYIGIGNIFKDQNNYPKAIAWLQKGLSASEEMGTKDLMMNIYKELSEIYDNKNDYKNAYKYHQLYTQIKDSIFNETSNKQIVEMQTKYETEKKEKEIEIQSLKISEQESLLNRNRIYLILYSIGILLLIALGWAAFSRYRIKQQSQLKSEMLRQQELRTNAVIETQEQERKRIAQDLHDGIGHMLTTVKINFEKIAEDIGIISPEKRIILEQTASVLDETHKEVRTLSHSMMPKALKERELSGAVSDLMEQTLANSKIKYLLKNDSPEELPENVQVCLYRVLQELLNNILKHAHATEIAVQIFKNKDTLIMMVEDDGIGIDGEGLSGIGLHNIAGRVHALKGFFLIEPGPVKGTIATVRIPIKQ